MAKLVMSLYLVVMVLCVSCNEAALGGKISYNVMSYGAKADGKTDSTKAFLKAWSSVCSSAASEATMFIPKGRFLLRALEFRGPCRNRIKVQVQGTLLAPSDFKALGNSGYWILFIKVNRISLIGGTIDAKGSAFWPCKTSKNANCPVNGARSITFNWAKDVVISGLTSINSQLSHLVINSCNNVMVRNVRMIAPDESPNTDGIHVQGSNSVTINGATMQTGDDCISIGAGTTNLFMTNIKCGPGHGVSIGSLGKEIKEAGVENVTLTNAVFTGSDNGVRIKSWARTSNGFVRNVLFQNIVMKNVDNPIIIDQNYCPNNQCPKQSSGVKISKVTYRNIQGTSGTAEAVTFDCSPTNPCREIKLQDIKLTFMNKPSTSSCKHIVSGSTSGVLVPRSCL